MKRRGGPSRSKKTTKSARTPSRTYPNSRVPLASRGWRPNSVEKKVNDNNVNNYNINTTGSVTLLANPALGTDFNQRIGRRITYKSIYIRGFVSTDASNTPTVATNATPSSLARMILLYDAQPNGAAPAILDVLVTASACAQFNLNNRDRFIILADKTFALGHYVVTTTATQALASTAQQVYKVKCYKKVPVRAQDAVFNAVNGGTVADINTGALFMIWIGTVAAGATDSLAQVSTRVRFNDK